MAKSHSDVDEHELLPQQPKGAQAGGNPPTDAIHNESRHEQRQDLRRRRQSVFTTWFDEIGAWFLAFALFSAIVGIPGHYSGKRQPDWKPVTLSGIVTFLGTFIAAAVAVPISAGLGQLKWLWFDRQHQLRDFDRFDEASRGPLGSLKMILCLRGGSLVIIGCVFCVLSTVAQTFLVQIVALHPDVAPVQARTPRIPIARQASANYYSSGRAAKVADPDFTSALLTAVYGPSTSQNYTVPTGCTTGNCTWPAYQTLAVCSTCKDISNSIITTSGGAKLPNGFGLNQIDDVFKARTTLQYSANEITIEAPNPSSMIQSEAFRDQGSVMADLLFMYSPMLEQSVWPTYIDDSPAAAPEFLLGGYSSVNIYQLTPPNAQYEADMPLGQQRIAPRQTYQVIKNAQALTSLLFATTFSGTASLENGAIPEGTNTPVNYIYAQLDRATDRLGYLRNLTGNIAPSLSREIRMYNWVGGGTSLGDRIEASGTTTESIIRVRVQWAWLTLPAIVLAVALGFLIAVVWATEKARAYAWKNSALAPLVLGLDGGSEEDDLRTKLGELRDFKHGIGSKRATMVRKDELRLVVD